MHPRMQSLVALAGLLALAGCQGEAAPAPAAKDSYGNK